MIEVNKIYVEGIIIFAVILTFLFVRSITKRKAKISDYKSELIIKKDFIDIFSLITNKKSINEYNDLKMEISDYIYIKLKDKNNIESINYIDEEKHRIKYIKEILESKSKYITEQLSFIIIACVLTPLIEFLLNDFLELGVVIIILFLVYVLYIMWRFDDRVLKRDRSITLLNIYNTLLEEEKSKLEKDYKRVHCSEIELGNKRHQD